MLPTSLLVTLTGHNRFKELGVFSNGVLVSTIRPSYVMYHSFILELRKLHQQEEKWATTI